MPKPRLLTIAGSDSSGGAGIEADLKTFTVHGCYGMTCITGLTAQNTKGVRQIWPVDSQEMIRDTLDAVFEDVGVDVVKTGMLTSKETVVTVVHKLAQWHKGPIVVDPVMVSTSGANLIPEDAVGPYIDQLIPKATLITPNIPEALFIAKHAGLSGASVDSVDDVKLLAKSLKSIGCQAVLIKGGHLGLDDALKPSTKPTRLVDVLYDENDEFHVFESSWIESKNTHGTGCTLASAIASNLGLGLPLAEAVKRGVRYVQLAISTAEPLGAGNGPINHTHAIAIRPFTEGHFVEYLLNHPKVRDQWQLYVNHPFTKQLARGTLPLDTFRYFLTQDYLYLVHYARAHALAGYKSTDMDLTAKSAQVVLSVQKETKLHIEYCAKFGVTENDLRQATEGLQCYAYSRYLLDVGLQDDWAALQFALSPCLLGYVEAARILVADPESVPGSKYWRWVETYTSPDLDEAFDVGKQLLEKAVLTVSPHRLEQLIDIFATTTKMECQFWNKALTGGK